MPANTWDFPRLPENVAILLRVGANHGLTANQCLHGCDIDIAYLQQPGALVEPRQEFQVIRNLIALLGMEVPLALEAGQAYQLASFGVWSFAVLSSRTAGEAAEVGVRYARLTSAYTDPQLVNAGDSYCMTATTQSLPDDLARFLLIRDAVTLLNLQRQILPMPVPLSAARTTFSRPPSAAQLDAFLGVPVSYGQTDNAFVVPAALAEFPLPRSDQALFQRCEEECQALLEKRVRYEGLAGKVRLLLARRLDTSPTMEQVAERLGMSSRTLRRKLEKEGTIYEQLLTRLRLELGREMLTQTNYPIAEIAARLGYHNPTNFTRAFSRWADCTPLKYRQQRGRKKFL